MKSVNNMYTGDKMESFNKKQIKYYNAEYKMTLAFKPCTPEERQVRNQMVMNLIELADLVPVIAH
jgi:hypothetical protein